MFDAGILTIYRLTNATTTGDMPREMFEKICDAYYDELSVGVTRAYAALSADQHIDLLVRCYNTKLTIDAEYVVIGTEQYRITLKQKRGDDIDLTLERLEEYLDVNHHVDEDPED